jgi:hypothetical protein
MLVPLKVSAASAGPAVTARTPTMMPMKRGQPAFLSSDDFILEAGCVFGNDRFDNNNLSREKRNPQGEAVRPWFAVSGESEHAYSPTPASPCFL